MTQLLLNRVDAELAAWPNRYECAPRAVRKLVLHSPGRVWIPLDGLDQITVSMFADAAALSDRHWFVELIVRDNNAAFCAASRTPPERGTSPAPAPRRPIWHRLRYTAAALAAAAALTAAHPPTRNIITTLADYLTSAA